ncbi:odontogenic ameloblast-associated protein-like [Microcaecilia unicolor]|uniref:Odontogenic ameloblast-associated protein n=1 Tax=Microcaecilia unicolor TaxID=1415580 RepID=A0A6P7XBQ1_9AMPH|nr:odontogenic ameloblast-associated protein-like [Microcaecilia unicolor]
MKIVTLFVCLFGTAFALPLIPQRFASGSASNELLVGLGLGLGAGAGGLVPPLQQLRTMNPFIPPILELVQQQQQQPQNPVMPQNPFAVRIPFAARLTNAVGIPGQMPFPGQGQFPQVPQGTQQGQHDPMQSQIPQQNQQQPNQLMPYIISYGMPPRMDQNMPPFTQFGFIPQRGGFVMPGGQQQPMPNDVVPGGATVTQVMPAVNVVPHFPNEILNFGNANPGALILLPSQAPTTPGALTSSTDPAVDPSHVENKVNTNLTNEP